MLNLEKIQKLKSDKVGFFRFKKFDDDTYLITNDIGKYCFLTKEDFSLFIEGKITSGEKYEELLEKSFIKNEEYEKNMVKGYVKKNDFLAFGPSLHIIITSLRCNHKCQYCHAAVSSMSAKNVDMNEETAKKVVDAIFYTSNPNITIEFQGGESLVNWDIVKFIIEYAEPKASNLSKSLSFALVTNLTLMDDEKLDYLIKHNVGISTSLDGDEELHNYNRVYNYGNSFKEVSYWIKRINKKYSEKCIKEPGQGSRNVGALLTVTKKSLSKYKEIIDTYLELGLDSVFIRPLNPYGFAASEQKKLGYTRKEFLDFYTNCMNYIMELNKKGIYFKEVLSSIYLNKILTPRDPNYLDERSPCGACIGQVAYNYDGKIYSCDEGRMLARMGDDNFLMTEVKENGEDTYRDMIESETTKTMVQASTLDGLPGYNDSVYKPYIGVCPIHSYKLYGNIIPNYSKDEKKEISHFVLDYLFNNIRIKENKAIFDKWVNSETQNVVNTCDIV